MEIKEQLPGFVLAELYNKSIVQISEEKKLPLKEELSKAKSRYLGNYEKKIIVLVNDAENIYAGDAELQFLTGMLNACKLNLAHIALINFNKEPVTFIQLKKEMKQEYLVSFGITALETELPFDMPHYQVQQYDNCKILTAPSLQELNSPSEWSKTEKTKLWKSLKKIFGLEK